MATVQILPGTADVNSELSFLDASRPRISRQVTDRVLKELRSHQFGTIYHIQLEPKQLGYMDPFHDRLVFNTLEPAITRSVKPRVTEAMSVVVDVSLMSGKMASVETRLDDSHADPPRSLDSGQK